MAFAYRGSSLNGAHVGTRADRLRCFHGDRKFHTCRAARAPCAGRRQQPCSCGMKMARKDVGFAHPAVVKEPVGRAGVGPIAAGRPMGGCRHRPAASCLRTTPNRFASRSSAKRAAFVSLSIQSDLRSWDDSVRRENRPFLSMLPPRTHGNDAPQLCIHLVNTLRRLESLVGN